MTDATKTKLGFELQTPPVLDSEWPLILGDCAANLRASLEHLAWDLVLSNGGQPNFKTTFPIKLESLKDGSPSARVSPGISPQALAIVEAVQPYASKGQADHHPLTLLDKVAKIDRHRTLVVVASAVNQITMYATTPAKDVHMSIGPISAGEMVVSYDFGETLAPVDFDPRIVLGLTFGDPHLGNRKVLDSLRDWIDYVETSILEPVAQSLGTSRV